MAGDTPSHPNHTRYRTELKCLPRSLIPMPEDSPTTTTAKITGFVFVVVWLSLTLALALRPDSVTIPPYYVAFTALVFLIIGKMWDIEVHKLLPGN